MRVFIASSHEGLKEAELVATWLESVKGLEPMIWNIGCFTHDRDYFSELIRISRQVDGAVFVFTGVDENWNRDCASRVPNSNVIFEHGLFTGTLGRAATLRVLFNKPAMATDYDGLHPISLGKHEGATSFEVAMNEIRSWGAALLPRYLNGLGTVVADAIADLGAPSPVDQLLGEHARRLIKKNKSADICAVCSDKGVHGRAYYAAQFKWVRKKSKRERRLRRLFVRRKEEELLGFTANEIDGILQHVDEKSRSIKAKWIDLDDPDLRHSYTDSLGFAIFGDGWLAHWGLENGYYYEPKQVGDGMRVGPLLTARFESLWSRSTKFSNGLIRQLREATK